MDFDDVVAPFGAANAHAFAAALEAVTFSGRFASQTSAAHALNLARLMETPAPDAAGLAAKMEVADQMDLEQYAALVADARLLAQRESMQRADARVLLAFVDALPGETVPDCMVAVLDRLEAELGPPLTQIQ